MIARCNSSMILTGTLKLPVLEGPLVTTCDAISFASGRFRRAGETVSIYDTEFQLTKVAALGFDGDVAITTVTLAKMYSGCFLHLPFVVRHCCCCC